MKYKLKTRLFAALALSGVSFYWPASQLVAQENDFGFIRPAEPSRQDVQELIALPIAQANPPIAKRASIAEFLQPSTAVRPPASIPPVVQASATLRRSVSAAPMSFAASKVFNGSYVAEGGASVGYAQHEASSQGSPQATAQQVSHQSPVRANELPPIVSGADVERDLPPIVQSGQATTPQVIQPFDQNDSPPIFASVDRQASVESGLPPVVTPQQGLDRLLSPIQTSEQGGSLLTADGSSIDQTSRVQPAAFGASPLLVQDAPPIIVGTVSKDVPGRIPSTNGVFVPIDPAVELPGVDAFPRANSLEANAVAPRSVFEQDLPIQPPTTPHQQFTTPRQPTTAPRQPFFEPAAQQAPLFGGCSTCGSGGGSCGCSGAAQGSGVSSCSSCGEGGCFDPAQVESIFNSSGANAYARQYAIAEVLYFDRTEGQINNSNFGSLNNFDPSVGARITVGRRTDSTSGREFQYSGIAAAEQTRQVFSDGGLAQSQFVPTGGLTGGNLQAFFNATEQSQSAETYFHSLEYNKVKWGWDVIKSYVGLRYIYVDDEYTLFSQSGGPVPAEIGFFQLAATNHLIGPHIGGELYYDVGYRWSLSGVSRLGAYLNINQFDTHLVNDGVEFIDAEDTNSTVSFTYEIGLNAKYRLTRQAQFRIGYNILFFDNLATASDNLLNTGVNGGIPVSPTLGSTTTDEESVLFHGLSIGFEFYR